MAFCPNCGTQTEGRFCPNCGSNVPTGTAGSGPAYTATAGPGLKDNVAGTLCYLFGIIGGVIFLVLAPYNRNRDIRFHAWQSIFLTLAAILVDWIAGAFLFTGFGLWRLMGLLHFFWFAVWVYMMFQTFQGRTVRLPVIGDLAAKQS